MPKPIVNCTTCNKKIKLRPCRVGQFKKNYCDNDCRTGEKYSWAGYLLANMQTMTGSEMAAHIGLPKNTLRTWVFRINQDLPAKMRIRLTKRTCKHMDPIKVGRAKKVKPIKVIKQKTIKMPVLKKRPMAQQATQHGPMLAGKTLINQSSTIPLRNPFNPATHERVYVPERKCWVERKKTA